MVDIFEHILRDLGVGIWDPESFAEHHHAYWAITALSKPFCDLVSKPFASKDGLSSFRQNYLTVQQWQ